MEIIKGDLIKLSLRGQFELIAHGCNCQNVMGGGIAAQIKATFSDAYEIDKLYNEEFKHKIEMMGTFSTFWYSNEREGDQRITFDILNLYTQLFPGLPSPGCKIPFDYEAFTVICRKVNNIYRGKHIGLPWIGCGLGGAFQPEVAAIINSNLNEMQVTVVDYEDNQADSRSNHTRGLGDASRAGEGNYTGREGDTGEFTMGRDDVRRGAPVKLENHEVPTTDAAGRHYWIGDPKDRVEMEGNQPEDRFPWEEGRGNDEEDLFD